MLRVGELLEGKYRIENVIGQGGMSIVYQAVDVQFNKIWAVKELQKKSGSRSLQKNLHVEIEMLKKLQHPRLVKIIDTLETADSYIIVMEYVVGQTLENVVRLRGPQSLDAVIVLAYQIIDVLSYLHSRKPPVIYRDLKPANIILRPDGNITLIDFGTAREFKRFGFSDTVNLGTIGYAAPEQYGGKGQSDERTDIYTLGATLYHLLTGYSPADTQLTIYPVGQFIPELKGSQIERIVEKCCQIDPANRYQSCDELIYDLNQVYIQNKSQELSKKQYGNTGNESKVKDGADKKVSKIVLVSSFILAIIVVFVSIVKVVVYFNDIRLYEDYIAKAKAEPDEERAIDLYGNAMNLSPKKPETYNGILELITSDGEINETERHWMAKNLNNTGSRESNASSNIQIFENTDDYADFAYSAGFNFYTLYKGSKEIAHDYFKKAIDKGLGGNELQRAEVFLRLTESYISIEKYGDDSDRTWYDVWQDWNELLVEETNPIKALFGLRNTIDLCNEVAYQISVHCFEMYLDGVSEANMTVLLDRADELISRYKGDSKLFLNRIDETQRMIMHARLSVQSAFG